MKDNLLALISQIDTIEAKFHRTPSSSGYLMPSVDEIGDVPEFQMWIQSNNQQCTAENMVEAYAYLLSHRIQDFIDPTENPAEN
mgnify:CR=1 FL=1